jgi:branched-chain amino acid transport system permease protein
VSTAGSTSSAFRRVSGRLRLPQWVGLGVLLVFLAGAPTIFDSFTLSQILTKTLWLGIAAASLIFLSSYGGMVSLGQTGIYAVAGFTMANLVHAAGGKSLGWDPLAATAAGIAVGTLFGLLCGAVAARSHGIYFLMITLAISVIVFYFFAQVTTLSGYGGIRSVTAPPIIGNPILDPIPLYYAALGSSIFSYVAIRYLARTPFGIALQGIRDDPARMQALGFNVPLHRALAFAVGAFFASIAGILSVWYTTQISPGGINVAQTINILVIAVIGGLYRLEGAWIGALVFATIDNYSRVWMPNLGDWLGPDRFETVIGLIFLVIVLASPGGLVGIWESAMARRRRQSGQLEPSGAPLAAAVDDAADAPPASIQGGERGDQK